MIIRILYTVSVIGILSFPSANASPPEAIYTVRGTSLTPLVRPNQEIRLIHGFYDQNPVQREDIIAYAPGHADVPIIKIVKAVEGDTWEVKKESASDFCTVHVNGHVLKNSQEHEYRFPLERLSMLDLYAKHYPVIPKDTYFILGDRITGTLDSTRFGLIHKRDIIGKVEILNNEGSGFPVQSSKVKSWEFRVPSSGFNVERTNRFFLLFE